MKIYRKLSNLITFTFIFIAFGCSGGGGDSTAPVSTEEVNLLGTWDYTLTTTDECAGFVAIGILDFQSLNGDITKIGNLLIQGEGFNSVNGVCNLTPIDITNTEWVGRPAVQTVNQFLAFKQLDLAGTGQTVRYDAFTSTQIVEVTTMPGSVGTFVWTRNAPPTFTTPVANAGNDTKAVKNVLVVLDGSESSDVDGDSLTYSWTLVTKPLGSSAILSDASHVFPTFTTDLPGDYIVSLEVNDGTYTSTSDTVSINVINSISHLRDAAEKHCYGDSLSQYATITCPDTTEAFYGQDAQYSTNPLVFVDNGLTVSDTLTGLMWQKSDNGSKYNWYQAAGIADATYNPGGATDVCGSLVLGGHSDWRLPARRELTSLINYSEFNGAPAIAEPNYFQTTDAEYYWSTTWDSSGNPWGVRAEIHEKELNSPLLVRCARGAMWGQNNYVDNGDGTITDNMSGLIWQQANDGVARNWASALAYCEGLVFAESSDWRLPDIKELDSVITINLSNETIHGLDGNFFGVSNGIFWSSTTYSGSQLARVAELSSGIVVSTSKDEFRFALCVR